MNELLRYYSRKDVQKAIFESSVDREIAVKFGDKGFGKRPDILQFEKDVYELVKQGATSFNISEERWQDPLLLRTGMTKKQLDDLRIGWDLLIDIDGLFEYSKIAAYLVVEALKFHNIYSYSIKFSGNKGFHILIPFETFPSVLNNLNIKDLFPEAARIIASYLKNMIKEHLIEKISSNNVNNEKFDVFSLVDIDSIAISSRHMFRSPYSFNEKSGLISIPIKDKDILNFDKEKSKPENVDVNLKFLNLENIKQGESSQLMIQAYDWFHKTKKYDLEENVVKKNYSEITSALDIKYFPPCILNGLKGLEDGKKRFLFVFINFLRNIGYNDEQMKQLVLSWNKKNKEPLRENYINAQLTWQKKQKSILPQNCPKDKENLISNQDNIYVSLGICKPDNLCKLIKNPVNYTIRKSKFKIN